MLIFNYFLILKTTGRFPIHVSARYNTAASLGGRRIIVNRKYISANQLLQSVLSWRQPGTHEQPVALKIVWSPVVCSFLLFNAPVQRANIMTFDVRRWVRGASGSLWRDMKGKVVVVVCCLWALDELTVGSASHATEAAKVITMMCCVWHERAQLFFFFF